MAQSKRDARRLARATCAQRRVKIPKSDWNLSVFAHQSADERAARLLGELFLSILPWSSAMTSPHTAQRRMMLARVLPARTRRLPACPLTSFGGDSAKHIKLPKDAAFTFPRWSCFQQISVWGCAPPVCPTVCLPAGAVLRYGSSSGDRRPSPRVQTSIRWTQHPSHSCISGG